MNNKYFKKIHELQSIIRFFFYIFILFFLNTRQGTYQRVRKIVLFLFLF